MAFTIEQTLYQLQPADSNPNPDPRYEDYDIYGIEGTLSYETGHFEKTEVVQAGNFYIADDGSKVLNVYVRLSALSGEPDARQIHLKEAIFIDKFGEQPDFIQLLLGPADVDSWMNDDNGQSFYECEGEPKTDKGLSQIQLDSDYDLGGGGQA